jgi:hypothetical protein
MRVLTKAGYRHPVFVAFKPLVRVSASYCRRDVEKVVEPEHLAKLRCQDVQPPADAHARKIAPTDRLVGRGTPGWPGGYGFEQLIDGKQWALTRVGNHG